MQTLQSNVSTTNKDGQSFNVQFTRDYHLFKVMSENREISAGSVIRLQHSMKNNGVLMNPIFVNEKMEIIDGQHRFHALKELGKEVPFIVMQGYSHKHVHVLNMQARNWTSNDFLEYHYKQGNPNYVQVYNFMNKYTTDRKSHSLSLNAAMYLLAPKITVSDKFVTEDGRVFKIWEAGEFKVNNHAEAKMITDYLFETCYPEFDKWGNAGFVESFYLLLKKYPKYFTFDGFTKKFPYMVRDLKFNRGGKAGYLKTIIEHYNYRRQNKTEMSI